MVRVNKSAKHRERNVCRFEAAAWGRGALRDSGPSGCEGDYFSGDGTLEHGRNANALLGSKRFKGSAMAVRLNFSRPQLSPNACLLVLRLLIGTVFTIIWFYQLS